MFLPATRTVTGIVSAAVLVTIGMWIERYFIVVGGLRVPLMPYTPAAYAPTWIEWSIMAGAFAWFGLVIAIFSKLFPVIAVWEVAEHHEESVARAPTPTPVTEAAGGYTHAVSPSMVQPEQRPGTLRSPRIGEGGSP